jgi:RND family efflux transporter MFP subunit
VVVNAVTFKPERVQLEAIGTSRAFRSVVIHPAAAGEVVAIHFESGQSVDAGDLLLELDARDQKLALQLAELRITDAQRLVDRYARADGSDAIPPTDVDDAQTALAEAVIERDRARVALDDRFVRAPFRGVVGLTDIDAGDRIDPTTPITTLDDRQSLLVLFEVPEVLLDTLDLGQQVEITTWTRRGPTASGELVELGSRIDPVTRTVVARARVLNPNDRLRPGMSFKVNITVTGDAYPRVPEVSVQWGADGAYVWTVRDGKAERVPAEIVQRQEGFVLIDAPLVEGDPVVVEGVQSMRDGRQIEVLDERT